VEWSIDVSNGEHRAASQLDRRYRHSRGQLSPAPANYQGDGREAAFSTMMAATIPAILVLVVFSLAGFANAQPPSGYFSALDQRSMSQAMLDAHNAVRARVGVPPLVWADQLAAVAQGWANHLIATNAFSHRPNNRFGENLYMIAGGTASPANVVGMWADEARGYDIRSNTCSGVCGHYTQIVWRETRAVGCAVVANPYREVWVCNYDPPGNVIGYRPY
jgi:pathogenesis-related protein 1